MQLSYNPTPWVYLDYSVRDILSASSTRELSPITGTLSLIFSVFKEGFLTLLSFLVGQAEKRKSGIKGVY